MGACWLPGRFVRGLTSRSVLSATVNPNWQWDEIDNRSLVSARRGAANVESHRVEGVEKTSF